MEHLLIDNTITLVMHVLTQARLMSEDYGKHLMGVEDLLQKHSMLEADISVVGERVTAVNSQAQRFIDDDFSEIGGNHFCFNVLVIVISALLTAVSICNILPSTCRSSIS